ncbi:MAG: hypothetical protein D6820_14705 [Lentisphaerae bacterium]|nr:MAG: hypothetical protein D6820_14705 [Lentisphaerota bacterium]
MPAANVTLYAQWTVQTRYKLTVINGSGSGSYTAGTQVTVTADPAPSGKVFDQWTGDTSYLASVTDASTTLTMPAGDLSITATYKDAPAAGGGSGGGGCRLNLNTQDQSVSLLFIVLLMGFAIRAGKQNVLIMQDTDHK